MDTDKTKVCMLLDFYSDILSKPVSDCLDLYYNDDLSLSEISENLGITRQGVRDNLLRGMELMLQYEEKLRLCAKYTANKNVISSLRSLVLSSDATDIQKKQMSAAIDTFTF